jgi:enoyl-[acyl-carrier protein] reductase III
MIDLSGRLALITGASRGIGRACARALVDAGADVIINYRVQDAQAEAVADELSSIGARVTLIKGDVSQAEDCEAMIGHIAQHFGRLDILVHNAASGGFRGLLEATTAQFDAAMHTNALSLLHLIRHAAPLMVNQSQRSKVVVLSSAGTQRAIPAYGLVGASKAALAAMARHLVLELGGKGVNINVLEAGLVETDSTRQLPGSAEMFKARISATAVGDRFLQADDVANAALFLCSPLSDLIQGQTLVVDGGASILA